MSDGARTDLLGLTAEITLSYVEKHNVSAGDLPALIKGIHAGLASSGLSKAPAEALRLSPAVPVSKSVADDYLICLEDGQHFKSLKSRLRVRHDVTPEQYRAKWGLPASYPMVAPTYAARRSALAKSFGLGRVRSGGTASKLRRG
jgi:predicted transcriptional regulator